MRDLSVDFRLVRLALASAQYGSFRQAAIALNVQQSSVSKAVRALEHRVGVELFERSHTGIQATLAGGRFLEEAALGFDSLERAIERVGAVRSNEQGELSVVTSIPLRLFADVLEHFRRVHAGVSVEITEGNCDATALLVQRRKVDVGFVARVRSDADVRSMHLRNEQMIAVLPKSHRLAKCPSLTLAQLRSEHFILSSGGLGEETAQYLREHLPGIGNELSLNLHHVGQLDLVQMVACGFGLTIVLENALPPSLEDVVLIPLLAHARVPITVLWMEANSNPALRVLLDILRQSTIDGAVTGSQQTDWRSADA